MVELMKRSLRMLVGRSTLTYEELLTVLTEIEAVINSRTLTYMTASDLDEPFTPSHLIMGSRLWSLPDHMCDSDSDLDYNSNNKVVINKRAKHLQTILEHFWTRWKHEYLLDLRESHRHHPHCCTDSI
uniref:DUF5641 domain-containing protein n=1 Tax=Amphimedon queenslandica TaxID=400682 RepID=A0A1X7TWU4_AMPQE